MAIGGVLFDIDGVLVTSWKPIAGAAETLQVMARNQIACSYLTNTTTRTRVQIAELLTEAGMAVRADEVITAAVLTAEYVRNRYPDARCFLVNSGRIAEIRNHRVIDEPSPSPPSGVPPVHPLRTSAPTAVSAAAAARECLLLFM